MTRRSRRRLGLRGLLLILLGLLVFLWFQGWLPLPGDQDSPEVADREGRSQPSAEQPVHAASPDAGGATPVSSDVVSGRRARLDWMLAKRDFAAAVGLARAMTRSDATADERAIGRRYLAPRGEICTSLERELNARLARREFTDAEAHFRLMAELDPQRASFAKGPIAVDADVLRKVATAIGKREVSLDGNRVVRRLDPVKRKFLLRVPGAGGGFLQPTVACTDLSPLDLRQIAESAAPEEAQQVRDAFAATLRTAKPLAAWVVQTGSLSLPAPDRGRTSTETR